MWPYRHVFHATRRNAGTPALRRALPAHIRALCAIRRPRYRRPRVYMYAGHIDTQFDTHRLHNRPISRRGSGSGLPAEASRLQWIRFNRLRSGRGARTTRSFSNHGIRIFLRTMIGSLILARNRVPKFTALDITVKICLDLKRS